MSRRKKTASYRFEWAQGEQPEEINSIDLGMIGCKMAVYDTMITARRYEQALERWRKEKRKASRKKKKAPAKPTLSKIAEGQEPEYEALAEIIECAPLEEGRYRARILVIFKDYHQCELAFQLQYKPSHLLSSNDTIQIEEVDLGEGTAQDREKRHILIGHLGSHLAREINDRVEQLLTNLRPGQSARPG